MKEVDRPDAQGYVDRWVANETSNGSSQVVSLLHDGLDSLDEPCHSKRHDGSAVVSFVVVVVVVVVVVPPPSSAVVLWLSFAVVADCCCCCC
jgi:hypothetical protein